MAASLLLRILPTVRPPLMWQGAPAPIKNSDRRRGLAPPARFDPKARPEVQVCHEV